VTRPATQFGALLFEARLNENIEAQINENGESQITEDVGSQREAPA
jgi:hypothetical protein